MSEAVVEPVTEAPAEATSIADHAAQYNPSALAEAAAPAEVEPVAAVEKPLTAQQRRDKDTGQYATGRVRHRAKSQQASPEDVPRIRELSGKVSAAEARATAAETELARLRASHAPAPQIAKAEARVEATAQTTSTDKEPDANDPKYAQNWQSYLNDHTRWAVRDERRQEIARETTAAAEKQQRETHAEILKNFDSRWNAAKANHADFEAVAGVPTRIPKGSAVDSFILMDDSGPEVLYYLQQHPDELDSLLRMPVWPQQAKALSLLSQRVLPSSSVQAGTTGAVAGRDTKIVLPPKPPTPVRTEAQRTGNEPAPTDGSLSIAEHAKQFGGKRK